MNSITGKSTGIALLLAAAMLAVMLAWSPFTAYAAFGTVAADDVDWDKSVALGTAVEVTITLKNDSDEITGKEDIAIVLPDGLGLDFSSVELTGDNQVAGSIGNTDLTPQGTHGYDEGTNTLTVQYSEAITPTVTVELVIPVGAGVVTTVEPTEEPAFSAVDAVCDNTVSSSCEPGAAVRLELAGTATAAVTIGEDIVVDLDDFGVPPTIAESRVLISFGMESANPSEVEVIDEVVTLTVPGGESGFTSNVSGEYTVTF